MTKPYVRKKTTIGKFTVWIVDGEWIRSNKDEEFTNFGQHYRYKFIPKDELWIDQEAKPDESRFFVAHMLTEYRKMEEGASYATALKAADKVEKTERKRTEKTTEEAGEISSGAMTQNHVKISPLGRLKDGTQIELVDGEKVRDLYDIDWTEGGHGLVYKFIPNDEIWIDDDVKRDERKFIILHEATERDLMKSGVKYEEAHKRASDIEWKYRHNPDNITAAIGATKHASN